MGVGPQAQLKQGHFAAVLKRKDRHLALQCGNVPTHIYQKHWYIKPSDYTIVQ